MITAMPQNNNDSFGRRILSGWAAFFGGSSKAPVYSAEDLLRDRTYNNEDLQKTDIKSPDVPLVDKWARQKAEQARRLVQKDRKLVDKSMPLPDVRWSDGRLSVFVLGGWQRDDDSVRMRHLQELKKTYGITLPDSYERSIDDQRCKELVGCVFIEPSGGRVVKVMGYNDYGEGRSYQLQTATLDAKGDATGNMSSVSLNGFQSQLDTGKFIAVRGDDLKELERNNSVVREGAEYFKTLFDSLQGIFSTDKLSVDDNITFHLNGSSYDNTAHAVSLLSDNQVGYAIRLSSNEYQVKGENVHVDIVEDTAFKYLDQLHRLESKYLYRKEEIRNLAEIIDIEFGSEQYRGERLRHERQVYIHNGELVSHPGIIIGGSKVSQFIVYGNGVVEAQFYGDQAPSQRLTNREKDDFCEELRKSCYDIVASFRNPTFAGDFILTSDKEIMMDRRLDSLYGESSIDMHKAAILRREEKDPSFHSAIMFYDLVRKDLLSEGTALELGATSVRTADGTELTGDAIVMLNGEIYLTGNKDGTSVDVDRLTVESKERLLKSIQMRRFSAILDKADLKSIAYPVSVKDNPNNLRAFTISSIARLDNGTDGNEAGQYAFNGSLVDKAGKYHPFDRSYNILLLSGDGFADLLSQAGTWKQAEEPKEDKTKEDQQAGLPATEKNEEEEKPGTAPQQEEPVEKEAPQSGKEASASEPPKERQSPEESKERDRQQEQQQREKEERQKKAIVDRIQSLLAGKDFSGWHVPFTVDNDPDGTEKIVVEQVNSRKSGGGQILWFSGHKEYDNPDESKGKYIGDFIPDLTSSLTPYGMGEVYRDAQKFMEIEDEVRRRVEEEKSRLMSHLQSQNTAEQHPFHGREPVFSPSGPSTDSGKSFRREEPRIPPFSRNQFTSSSRFGSGASRIRQNDTDVKLVREALNKVIPNNGDKLEFKKGTSYLFGRETHEGVTDTRRIIAIRNDNGRPVIVTVLDNLFGYERDMSISEFVASCQGHSHVDMLVKAMSVPEDYTVFSFPSGNGNAVEGNESQIKRREAVDVKNEETGHDESQSKTEGKDFGEEDKKNEKEGDEHTEEPQKTQYPAVPGDKQADKDAGRDGLPKTEDETLNVEELGNTLRNYLVENLSILGDTLLPVKSSDTPDSPAPRLGEEKSGDGYVDLVNYIYHKEDGTFRVGIKVQSDFDRDSNPVYEQVERSLDYLLGHPLMLSSVVRELDHGEAHVVENPYYAATTSLKQLIPSVGDSISESLETLEKTKGLLGSKPNQDGFVDVVTEVRHEGTGYLATYVHVTGGSDGKAKPFKDCERRIVPLETFIVPSPVLAAMSSTLTDVGSHPELTVTPFNAVDEQSADTAPSAADTEEDNVEDDKESWRKDSPAIQEVMDQLGELIPNEGDVLIGEKVKIINNGEDFMVEYIPGLKKPLETATKESAVSQSIREFGTVVEDYQRLEDFLSQPEGKRGYSIQYSPEPDIAPVDRRTLSKGRWNKKEIREREAWRTYGKLLAARMNLQRTFDIPWIHVKTTLPRTPNGDIFTGVSAFMLALEAESRGYDVPVFVNSQIIKDDNLRVSTDAVPFPIIDSEGDVEEVYNIESTNFSELYEKDYEELVKENAELSEKRVFDARRESVSQDLSTLVTNGDWIVPAEFDVDLGYVGYSPKDDVIRMAQKSSYPQGHVDDYYRDLAVCMVSSFNKGGSGCDKWNAFTDNSLSANLGAAMVSQRYCFNAANGERNRFWRDKLNKNPEYVRDMLRSAERSCRQITDKLEQAEKAEKETEGLESSPSPSSSEDSGNEENEEGSKARIRFS